MFRVASVAAVLLATVVGAAEPTTAERSPAEKAFLATVKAGHDRLTKLKAYSVRAEGKWKTTGGKNELGGTNTVAMLAENPGKLRIDVGAAGEKEPHLVIAADGKSITRHFTHAQAYSVTACDGSPLDDLQSDGVTVAALRAVGVDFLARPNMAAALATQILTVEALGESEGKRTGYRLVLANARTVEVDFAADNLPVSVKVSYNVPVGEKRTLRHTVETTLTWDVDARPKADAFVHTPPTTAKKVDDLYEAVVAADLGELVGKPAPAVEFTGVDGKAVKLADFAGKPVVVYAWAVWAAPSTERMAAVGQFVTEYEKKGAAFVAVNAGDTQQAVAEFVKQTKFPGTVTLDPLGAGLGRLRLQAVPAVVILDKEGKVFAYHRGGKPDTLEKVKADLDKLLK